MIRYFAGHPTAANLLMLLVVAAGLLSIPDLKRETFPRFAASRVAVDVAYPGASAADVEDAVCERLEDALESIENLAELTCEAGENLGQAVAEMADGADFARFLDDVKTEVDAIDDFPDRTERPVVYELDRTDFVASVAVTGPMAPPDLKAYAEDIKDRLLALPEVSQVDLRGFSDHQLRVEIPRAALQAHGLSVPELARLIEAQNVDLPGGTIETADQDVLLRFADERRTPKALAELVVLSSPSGAELRLGEIATITDRFEDEAERIGLDGRRAALLEVRKTRSEDALRVVDAVDGFLEAERRRAPPAVEVTLTQDVSSIVRDRLQMLAENGLQGLILVLLAMWAFFTFRFSFWVAAGLPVSFLGTFFVMELIGYSLNMITMVGLLMAIGLLMDHAIVISENIAAHLQAGRRALDAVVEGTRQVTPGVLSSFVTTAFVFGPLAFLQGDIGDVLKVMPVVLLVTLTVALGEAFLILPHHLVGPTARLQQGRVPRVRAAVERAYLWSRERLVGRTAELLVRHRYPFLGALLFVFAGSIAVVAGGAVKFQAFPSIDGDVVEARLLLPPGTPHERTRAVVERITGTLQRVDERLSPEQPGERPLVERVQVRYGENKDAGETGAHLATVIVDLLSAEVRTVTLDELYAAWREAIGPLPGVIGLTLQEPSLGPEGRALEIRLSGRNLDELSAASTELQAWLRDYRGTRDLMDDLRRGKPERRLRLREGATELGLTAADIAGQIRGAFLGEVAAEIQRGPEGYEIEVRQAEADRSSLADLDRFTVLLPDGSHAPLSAVAVIEPARDWVRIARIDGRRTATVTGDVDTRVANAMDIIGDTQERFLPELRDRYPGVDIAIEGQSSEASTTGASVRSGFALGLLGIFVVLAFQFRSYVEPVIVMTAIPLAMLGALWGHLLLGYEISMPSLVGAASLAGVVVNDSILLVQFVKFRVAEGMAVAAAAAQASRDRYRAVLLTSVTTILGLVPLLAERSLQAEVLKPLVISVIFGLLTSTVLVLLVLPALYSILTDFGLTKPRGSEEPPEALGHA